MPRPLVFGRGDAPPTPTISVEFVHKPANPEDRTPEQWILRTPNGHASSYDTLAHAWSQWIVVRSLARNGRRMK